MQLLLQIFLLSLAVVDVAFAVVAASSSVADAAALAGGAD